MTEQPKDGGAAFPLCADNTTFDQKVNEWRSRRLPKNRRSNGTLEAEIIRLTARVERLTTGLEFYADKANWCARIAVNGPGDVDLQDPVMSGDDHGKTARAALSTHTEEPKT